VSRNTDGVGLVRGRGQGKRDKSLGERVQIVMGKKSAVQRKKC
jgi:hypothetical protein